MEYVTFIENDHDRTITSVFFLQWNNNEAMLMNLCEHVSWSGEVDKEGVFSSFDMDIENRLSESTVNEMIKLECGSFKKLNGTFSYDFSDEYYDGGLDTYNMGYRFVQNFSQCGIRNYFK